MNLFVSDPCPVVSAQALDDKRIRKMVLETAQLLCTVIPQRLVLNNDQLLLMYRSTHVRHPITHWCGDAPENLLWTYRHYQALSIEYGHRFNKPHKTITQFAVVFAELFASFGFETPLPANFQNNARSIERGIDFSHIENVHEAYRQYLTTRFNTDKLTPQWTNRQKPAWYE